MRKLLRVAVIPLATIGLLMPAGPANATTFVSDGNAAGPAPTEDGKVCADSGATFACFTPLGDKIWVFDDAADGHHSEGQLHVNGDLFVCQNFTGSGTWRVCNSWSDLIPEHENAVFCAETWEGNTFIDSLCKSVTTTFPL
jgi:hypothetical protein